MSDSSGLVEKAGRLLDECHKRKRPWFPGPTDTLLEKRVVPMLAGLINQLATTDEDNERLRMLKRDLEAQVAGLKKRIAELEERRQNANGHLAECRTLHTKLSEAMSNARRETHAVVELEASE